MPVFLMREHELYPIVSKNRTVISIPSDSSLEDRPLQKIKMMVSQHSEPGNSCRADSEFHPQCNPAFQKRIRDEESISA